MSAQQGNCLIMHFSECIPVIKQHMTIHEFGKMVQSEQMHPTKASSN